MSPLLRAAVLGTAHSQPAEVLGLPAPGSQLVPETGSEVEGVLLLRAGIVATLRRGAQAAEQRNTPLNPSLPEQLAAMGPRLTALLGDILLGSNAELRTEALERVAHSRLLLAPELLPLALRQTSREARLALRPVLGERGRWLAGLRPEWRWALAPSVAETALAEDLEERWSEGSQQERKALFESARRIDANRARNLLLESWKAEKAEQRLAWVEALRDQLCPDDGEFLLTLQSDRSSQVKVAAARLLWKLTDSVVTQRVRGRAQSFLSFKKRAPGLLGKVFGKDAEGELDVTLPPEQFDATWERDGIFESPPQGAGRRQWWLKQTLAATPPSAWCTRFAVSPEVLVQAALEHEHKSVLLDAWTHAALDFEASEWWGPLLHAWLEQEGGGALVPRPREALLERLPREQLASHLPRLVELQGQAASLLHYVPRPWPESLAREAIVGLLALDPKWIQVGQTAALRIPVALLPADVPLPEVPENDHVRQYYLRTLDQFRAICATRRAIAEETRT